MITRALARIENRTTLRKMLSRGRNGGISKDHLAIVLDLLSGWPPARHVSEIAVRLGFSTRTLERRTAAAGFPAPRRCLAWCRLLEATTLWNWGAGSRANIASIVGMHGADTLAHLCRNLTRQPLGKLWCSSRGGELIQRFLQEGNAAAER